MTSIHLKKVGLEESEYRFKLHVDELVLGLFEQGKGEAEDRLDAFGEDNIEYSVHQRQREPAHVSAGEEVYCGESTGMRTAS